MAKMKRRDFLRLTAATIAAPLLPIVGTVAKELCLTFPAGVWHVGGPVAAERIFEGDFVGIDGAGLAVRAAVYVLPSESDVDRTIKTRIEPVFGVIEKS